MHMHMHIYIGLHVVFDHYNRRRVLLSTRQPIPKPKSSLRFAFARARAPATRLFTSVLLGSGTVGRHPWSKTTCGRGPGNPPKTQARQTWRGACSRRAVSEIKFVRWCVYLLKGCHKAHHHPPLPRLFPVKGLSRNRQNRDPHPTDRTDCDRPNSAPAWARPAPILQSDEIPHGDF